MTPAHPEQDRSGQRAVLLAAAMVAASGVVTSLVGWRLGIDWLRGGIPSLFPMNPNAAVALGLLAAAAVLADGGRAARALAATATAAALLLGGGALWQHLGGTGLTLDPRLFVTGDEAAMIPFMAPYAAIGSVLVGLALLVRLLLPGSLVTLAVLLGTTIVLSATTLLTLLYGADVLYRPLVEKGTSPFMALGLHVLAVGLFLRALPQRAWQTLTAATPTAVLLRRVLPVSLIGLVGVGYLALVGHHAGLLAPEDQVAAVVVVSGAVLVVLLVDAGFRLNRYMLETERARATADAATEMLHREALELNDDVVQKLSTAWLAHDLGDLELAHQAVRDATRQAQRIAAELLHAHADTLMVPGRLVRATGAEPLDPPDLPAPS